MPDFDYMFESHTHDVDCALRVEGSLPKELAGTFFSIGPAGAKVGSTPVHGLDGHGRVNAVRIEGGQARLRARMVQTPLWEEESKKGSIVKRRIFTNKPGRWSNLFDMNLGNNAWHNIVRFGDTVAATNDPGFFLLDPDSLETRGRAPLAPAKGAAFTPMPRINPKTGHQVVFEKRPGLKDTLIVRELDGKFSPVIERTYKLPKGAALFHDVAFSERYYVVIQIGEVSLAGALWGAVPLWNAVQFKPDSTPTLYLLPREGGAAIRIPLPGGRTHFHIWNAFDADGKVIVDTIGYDGRVPFQSLYPHELRAALGIQTPAPTPKGATWRYTIDPVSGTSTDERLTSTPAEAPAIRDDRRGQRYRFGWAPAPGTRGDEEDPNAYAWFHALARHDFERREVEQWDAGPRAHVSAASFVARPGRTEEDDGWVLAWIQDAATRTAALGVFDARRISAGPIAKLHGPSLVGMVSHVSFS